MTNGALFIGWGGVIPNREKSAQKVLNESMEYLVKLQREKIIESFEVVVLEPHGGELAGFVLVKGNKDAIAKLRTSEEFTKLIARVQYVHNQVGVVGAYTGAQLQALITLYDQQTEDLT